jgi:AGCS family alanine or glycine:cation symporter
VLYVAAVFIGGIAKLDVAWLIADLMNGWMALPNLVGLLLLSNVIVDETRSYFSRASTPAPARSA